MEKEKQKRTRRVKDKILKKLDTWTSTKAIATAEVCGKQKPKTGNEVRILSLDLGVVLSFCLLAIHKRSETKETKKEKEMPDVEILHWQAIRLCEASATRFETATIALEKIAIIFAELPEVDYVIIEEQPPTINIRTSALAFALYGYFWQRYATQQTEIRMIHSREKLIFCHQIGAESKKENVTEHAHNKDLSIEGTTMFLDYLAQTHSWAVLCKRWFFSQSKLDDLSDAFLQAISYYCKKYNFWEHVAIEDREAAKPQLTKTGKRKARSKKDVVVKGRKKAKFKLKEVVGDLQFAFE